MRTPLPFAAVFLLAAAALAAGQAPLDVFFVNVDQGDATLIVSPSGKTLLFDGGPDGMGNAAVVPLLRGRTLTYMVASHYHSDHIGGLDEVVRASFRPQVAWDRGTFGGVPSTPAYRDYANAIAAVRRTITPGTVIDLGAGVTAECVVVNGMIKGGPTVPIQPFSENPASVGLRIQYRNFQLWVGGDLTGGGFTTTDVEKPYARAAGDFDVLRVSHHGSESSTHWPFLFGLSPEVSIISCGVQNPFGHPHTEVLARLNALPEMQAIYQTTRGAGKPGGLWANGTIRLQTDGLTTYTVFPGVLPARTFPIDETLPGPPHPRRPGDLVVSELMPDPARVLDSVGEYFEIRNTTGRPLDLIGLTLRDDGIDRALVSTSVPVQPGGSVVIGRNGDPRRNGGYVPDLVLGQWYLSNSADEIVIDDPWGQTIDAVRYSSVSWPFRAGIAAERKVPAGPSTPQNFTGGTTTFGAGDRGTPGYPNAADPAFPAHLTASAGFPVPGGSLTLRLAGPPSRTYFVVISTTRAAIPVGPVTLGVGLDLFPLSFLFPSWIGNLGRGGVTTTTLPVPSVPALKGQAFYLQLVILGANALPESTSDVMRLLIG